MFEIVSFWVVVLSAVPFVFQYMRAMATTSLWNDEIYTILNHSGKGPVSVLTDYSSNNHLLINLLNSLFPGRTSFDPLRMRGISLLAVTFTLAGILRFFWRRRLYLPGAAVFVAVGLNRDLLDLCLQGRGYGLALLLALGATAAFLDAYEAPSQTNLLMWAGTSILGSVSIVTFGFWAAPLWAILLLRCRDSRVVIAALLVGAGVLVFHAGVLDQMIALQLAGYGERFGYQYGNWASVAETARLYILGALGSMGPRADGLAAALSLGFLAVLMVQTDTERAATRAPRALLLSAGLFLVFCLTLRTPLVRTTSFICMPVLIGCAMAMEPAYRERHGIRRLLAATLVLLAIPAGIVKALRFEFVPIETWKETGVWIERIFPAGLPVRASVAADYLEGYVASGRLTPGFDERWFVEGSLVVAETPRIESERRDIPSVNSASIVHLRIAQRRNGAQTLHFAPPQSRLIMSPPGLSDRNVRDCALPKPGRLTVPFPRGSHFRSFVVVDAALQKPANVRLRSARGTGGPAWSLHQDGLSLYGLGDQEIESVEIEMPPGSCLAEVWAYPVSFGQGQNE
ncbi:MAG: hypothetical protein IT186_02640 [Acidobacteria bacterium]|nr:hypothetical protein [Acidobacteriota bacterium]